MIRARPHCSILPARPPEHVESTAYFVVAEALTNVAKHSRAQVCRIAVTREDARDTDVARVRSRLAAGGWPLASPDRLRSTS